MTTELLDVVDEGIGTKLLSIRNYAARGAQNKALMNKAMKRDSDTKIVFISEERFNDKSDNGLYRAWNPEDFTQLGMFYGVYKQFNGTHLVANKKQLVVSKSFWDKYADSKILVFQVNKNDCNKGRDLMAQPVVTLQYTVSKDKLKTKKMAFPLRQFVKKCGWKAVASKVDGDELK